MTMDSHYTFNYCRWSLDATSCNDIQYYTIIHAISIVIAGLITIVGISLLMCRRCSCCCCMVWPQIHNLPSFSYSPLDQFVVWVVIMAFGRLIISVMLIARLDVSPIYYEMAWHFPLVSGISAMTIYCVDVIRCIPPRISPNWIPNYETIRNIHRSAIAVLYTIIMTLAAILGYFLEQRSHELSVIIYTVIYYIYTVIGLMLVLVYLVFGSRLVTLTIRQLNLYEANTRCDEAIQGKVISLQHSILRMRVQNAGGIITVAMCTICVFVSATFPSLIARHPIVNQILCVIYNILHPTFFLMIISIVTKFESMTIFESRRASHIQTNINNHSSYHESTEDAYYKDLIISIPSEPVILELDPIDVAPAYEQSNMAHQAISHELASVQHHNNVSFHFPQAP